MRKYLRIPIDNETATVTLQESARTTTILITYNVRFQNVLGRMFKQILRVMGEDREQELRKQLEVVLRYCNRDIKGQIVEDPEWTGAENL